MITKLLGNDILNKKNLIVHESESNYIYTCSTELIPNLKLDVVPFYVPPNDKVIMHPNGNIIYETIFLPITNKEFRKLKGPLIGYRFYMVVNNINSIGLIDIPNSTIVKFDLEYEVSRIRYSSDRRNTIHIEKSYDALFPTQSLHLECKGMEMMKTISDGLYHITTSLAGFYSNKEI